MTAQPSDRQSTTEYPDRNNTGVPPHLRLTRYEGRLTTSFDGQVIDAMQIDGFVEIRNSNVTLRRSRIVGETARHVIRVFDGVTGFRLEDSEIDGNGAVNCVAGWGTFLRNNIHACNNGVNLWGPSVVRDNYIHGLSTSAAEPDPHYDGIELNGGGDQEIVHNTILNSHSQTSAVMLNNYFNRIYRISVRDNLLKGGGYTVYVDWRKKGMSYVDPKTIAFINNRLGRGHWGYAAFYGVKFPWRNNVDAETGIAVSP